MKINYIYSESTVKPLLVEFTKNSVYLRRNITERTNSNGPIFYAYEEACLTHDEFNAYNSDNISNLVIRQETADDNQLTIMEAIADLYDMILNTKQGGTE